MAGIRCKKIAGPSHAQRHNLSYISFDYDLIVKTEHSFVTPAGMSMFAETELTDVKVGVEPDAGELIVPADFEVLDRRTGPASCSSCPARKP